jgi:hypothetical protein
MADSFLGLNSATQEGRQHLFSTERRAHVFNSRSMIERSLQQGFGSSLQTVLDTATAPISLVVDSLIGLLT